MNATLLTSTTNQAAYLTVGSRCQVSQLNVRKSCFRTLVGSSSFCCSAAGDFCPRLAPAINNDKQMSQNSADVNYENEKLLNKMSSNKFSFEKHKTEYPTTQNNNSNNVNNNTDMVTDPEEIVLTKCRSNKTQGIDCSL